MNLIYNKGFISNSFAEQIQQYAEKKRKNKKKLIIQIIILILRLFVLSE